MIHFNLGQGKNRERGGCLFGCACMYIIYAYLNNSYDSYDILKFYNNPEFKKNYISGVFISIISRVV